ncbi:MAG: DUF3090 family protein [Ornithinimicrobium sp.]
MPVIDFDPPERFIADSVGPAGQRTFFVQAIRGAQVMTVSLEKEQVRLLGESVTELLDEMSTSGSEGGADSSEVEAAIDRGPLHTPIEEDFRARALTLAWNEDRRRVTIEATDRDPDAEESPDGDTEAQSTDPIGLQGIRVVMSVSMARSFAQRCIDAMTGGRPNCPFCGGPLDPSGHICPRANGYRR